MDNVYYTYDSNNDLVSMNLNGVEYYYVRNGQDDIIGLIDGTGAQVVSYTYDSWGKLISIKDVKGNDVTNDTTNVGYKNPYRYRGYRYDTETGLYYLQSRYYNPEWGRFINADALAGSTGDLLSHNVFAYCKNNAVNMSDPSGYWWESIQHFDDGFIEPIPADGMESEMRAEMRAEMDKELNEREEDGDEFEGGGADAADVGRFEAECRDGIDETNNTNIEGKPHSTPEHRIITTDKVDEIAQTGEYDTIYINKALKTAGLNGSERPDIIAVSDGSAHIIEIASPGQMSGQNRIDLVNKFNTMLQNNPGITGELIFPEY